MRLTVKSKISGLYHSPNFTAEEYEAIAQKLGQLEDIEERHNIESIADLDNRLKVLKIIKEKRVDVSWLMKCFGFIENSTNEEECEYYNDNYEAYRNSKPLTQTEFDVLKEIFTRCF